MVDHAFQTHRLATVTKLLEDVLDHKSFQRMLSQFCSQQALLKSGHLSGTYRQSALKTYVDQPIQTYNNSTEIAFLARRY
jgi:hypothetical protein